MNNDQIKELGEYLIGVAKSVEAAGADVILLCANTIHMMAHLVERAVKIPLIHIVDATVDEIKKRSFTKVGLLGTKFTMEQNFLKKRYNAQGIGVIVIEEKDRIFLHHLILDELFARILNPSSKSRFLELMEKLSKQGVQEIVLGCTEFPLLVNQADSIIPMFDTTEIHTKAAVEWALKQ